MDVLGQLLLHLMREDTSHSNNNCQIGPIAEVPSEPKDEDQIRNKCHLFEQKA